MALQHGEDLVERCGLLQRGLHAGCHVTASGDGHDDLCGARRRLSGHLPHAPPAHAA